MSRLDNGAGEEIMFYVQFGNNWLSCDRSEAKDFIRNGYCVRFVKENKIIAVFLAA